MERLHPDHSVSFYWFLCLDVTAAAAQRCDEREIQRLKKPSVVTYLFVFNRNAVG